MSNYPGTIDSYNVITAGRKMNESGYALSTFLNSHGSAVINIENTIGTTAGTAMFTSYTASDKPLAHQSGTIQTSNLVGTFDTITGGNGAANNLILYSDGTIDLQGKVGLQQGTSTTFYDFEGNEMVEWARDTSAVNHFKFTNAGTSESPTIEVLGDDTNIDLTLTPKGTGGVSVQDGYVSSTHTMARQAIMNGNFDVWQRGTSVAIPQTTVTYQADRWLDYADDDGGTAPTLTRSRQLLTSGDIDGAFYHTRLTTDGAGTGLGTNAVHSHTQRIEHGIRNLAGTGNQITVSFWARSDITNKKIGVYVAEVYGTGGSPSATEFVNGTNWTLTSSWTKYTYTFTLNTTVGKTFGTNVNDYLAITFLYVWSTDTYDTYVDDEGNSEDYGGSGYIDMAQVQVCAGGVALPFQPKSYAQELAYCQRYYVKYPGVTTHNAVIGGADTSVSFYVYAPQTLRTTPIITYTGGANVIRVDGNQRTSAGQSGVTATSFDGSHWVYMTESSITTGLGVNRTGFFNTTNLQISAEL